jgi:hypothetical protein
VHAGADMRTGPREKKKKKKKKNKKYAALNLVILVGTLSAERKKKGRKERKKKETHKEGLMSLLHLSITNCLQICKIRQCTLPLNIARKS